MKKDKESLYAKSLALILNGFSWGQGQCTKANPKLATRRQFHSLQKHNILKILNPKKK